MASTPFLFTPFVGREQERALYQHFLTWPAPWVLFITGQAGIGKSTLLHHFASETPAGSLVITLDFAVPSLRLDPLTVLEEILWQVEPYANRQQVQMCQEIISEGRTRLAQPTRDISQEIHVAEHASFQGQGMQLTLNTALLESRRELRRQATQAFYTLMSRLTCRHVVFLLDTGEWLGEAEGLETGQWLLHEMLPLLRERLQRQDKRSSVVLASRMRLAFGALQSRDIYSYTLSFLNEAAVNDYLIQLNMVDASFRQRIYDLTHGHALCIEIIGVIWQQQGSIPLTVADFPTLQEQFNERAVLEFLQERLYQRLPSPFRELTKYCALFRSFDLPMLEAVCGDLLSASNHIELFDQFLRYPYIENRGTQRYACHDLLRELQANRIRAQEPASWQKYHQQALEYFAQTEQPYLLDWYYHALTLNEADAISDWEQAVQAAQIHGDRTYVSALLQVANDTTLSLRTETCATRAYQQGSFYYYGTEMPAALASYEEALALFRAVGDRLGEANVRQAMGDVQQFRDDREAALASYEEALALFRAVGDRLGEANVRQAMGDVQQFRDDREAALASYEEALALFRAVGDRLGEANVRKAMGRLAGVQEQYDLALDLFTEAYRLYNVVEDRYSQSIALYYRAVVYETLNDCVAALTDLQTAVDIAWQLKLPWADDWFQHLEKLQEQCKGN